MSGEDLDREWAESLVQKINRGEFREQSRPLEPELVGDEALRAAAQLAERHGIRLVRRPAEMQRLSHRWRVAGESIALVPTMGSLHTGHRALVDRATTECRHAVVSVFVNPTQFGPGEDYFSYPRRLAHDVQFLAEAGVAAIFAPSPDVIYPEGHITRVNVPGISELLEGSTRPGHFQGVATVVNILFNCVRPDRAYFGEKDAQQLAVVRRMARDLHAEVEIIACPTVRGADGLALSSRNAYLSALELEAATCLWRGLWAARNLYRSGERSGARLRRAVEVEVEQEALAELDYAQVVDPDTFEPVAEASGTSLCVVAARVGSTRLIDSIALEQRPDGGTSK